MAASQTLNFMELPFEMIDKILSYLSYDQIAKLRAVNRPLNCMCSDRLNKGFTRVEQFHSKCLKSVKSKLPRRESERRIHPLSRHCDILMAIETRLSMLSMTFSKYIEALQCCFIPGKVLDEALKVLRIVSSSLTPVSTATSPNTQYILLPRPHDFLQEYRDVSSMAMEHFDEKILPAIREKMKLENPRFFCLKRCKNSTKNSPVEKGPTLPTELLEVLQDTKTKCENTRKAFVALQKNVTSFTKIMKSQNGRLRDHVKQQGVLIRHLRRELRETRIAMNVMSKDLNELKSEQSIPRGQKRKRDSKEESCENK